MKRLTTFVICFALLSGVDAGAHHPGGAGSTSGGQLTMSPDSLLSGKAYAGLRIDWVDYEHISDGELQEAAEREAHLHGMEAEASYYLDVELGIFDALGAGISVPLRKVYGYREGHHHHEEAEMEAEGAFDLERSSPEGLGDIQVFAHLTLLRGPVKLGVRFGVEMPTGDVNERDDEHEKIEVKHQPGSGSWDFFAGVAAGYGGKRWQVQAAVTTQINTRGAREFEIGDWIRLGAGVGWDFVDPESSVVVTATLDAWIEWHGRDRDHGRGEEDSSGWVSAVAPGVRISAGILIFQFAVPIQLSNGIDQEPDQSWRAVASVGLRF
ncbi:MAG: hypothetical protein HYY18_21835 [Planctomycetes bacterium]|nr:hypothetical protein [Planctomycetota bacterium]